MLQFKQQSIFSRFYYYFSLMFLIFESFSMRGVLVKPPKAAIYRGAKCREVVFVSGFPTQSLKNLRKFHDQNLQIYGS